MTSTVAEVASKCFGGNLYQQGRGFYVTLELLAIVWGTRALDRELLPAVDQVETLKYRRRSHDLARRIATTPEKVDPDLRERLGGAEVVPALSELLSALTVDIPNRPRGATLAWFAIHFTPSIGELVHYDGRLARGDGETASGEREPQVERALYRGAGGLAHKILRSDGDAARLERMRAGFSRLVEDSESPLGHLANTLGSFDHAKASDYDDTVERDARTLEDLSPWPEILREGTDRILRRQEQLSKAKAVELLLYWVPYCLARHQLAVATRRLGAAADPIVCDFGSGPSAIRRLSRSSFLESRRLIVDALAAELPDDGDAPVDRRRWGAVRGFFTTSLAVLGGLNAFGGPQFFTLGLPLLEAIVAGSLDPGERVSFEHFCTRILAAQYGLVVDADSAEHHQLLDAADAATFKANAAVVLERLRALGLLAEYSDMTRFVGMEGA